MRAISASEHIEFPTELTKLDQWVLYRLVPIEGKETFTKVPYQVNGQKASSTDPQTWTSYEAALKHSHKLSGIGFVLTESDPYTVLDLDDCIVDGVMKDEAKTLVDTLDSYTEYSQSGNGLHIFINGTKPGKRSKNPAKGIELYDKERFIVMTGDHLQGTPVEIHERQMLLDYIYDSYFSQPEKEQQAIRQTELKLSPTLSDDDVISLASSAKNGENFKVLLNGDGSGYGSESEADLALCNHIAFYTQDAIQIDRIFTDSGLYREKWDREDYKAVTIQKAIDGLGATYQKNRQLKNVYNIQFDDVKDCSSIDLQQALKDRRFAELESMQEEWELNGKKGKKPTSLSPLRCAMILPEYVSFVLFDFEENTRLAMYQASEGIYTRNVSIIKRMISWLEPQLNSSRAEDVIYHLTNKADMKEKTESRYLIPVQNGVFNLKTKQLEPFSPDYVFTTKISTAYIGNPSLPIIDGWNVEAWLSSIACGDQEITNLLWQVMNDSLNGNYTRKKAIFLVGDGNNGKGTFQELIINLIGSQNIASLKVNEFDERFKLSALEGKTAAIGDDVPVNVYIDDSSNFNSVVTGDRVQVEFKNKPLYTTTYKCSVIQSTNGMPKFRNKTNGTIRRIIIVPFGADFNGSAENFKIKDEYIRDPEVLQYVLHKAIHMDFERFAVPAASERELEVFKQDNDPILDFKLSIFDEWNMDEVPMKIVYGFYKIFCNDNGYKHVADRQFHKQFKAHLGATWKDSRNRFHYQELLNALGDLDAMNIGFPDQTKVQRTYKVVTE